MAGFMDSLVPDMTWKQFERILGECDTRDRQGIERAQALYQNTSSAEFPPAMSDDIANSRREAWLPVALSRTIVEKMTQVMYGRQVERTTGNVDLDALFMEVWDTANSILSRIVTLADIEGDGVVRIMPDLRGRIKYTTWSGLDIVPLFDPMDPHGMPLGVIYDYLSDPLQSQIVRGMGDTGDSQDVKEVITRHIRNQETGAIEQPGIRVRFVNGKAAPYDGDETGLNPLGDFLDGVFWKNAEDPYSARGVGILAALMPTLTAFNELLTSGHELIRWNLWPILVVKGSMAQKPVYSPRTVMQPGANPDGTPGDVTKIEWSENMGGYMDYLNRILDLIYQTSGMPAVSVGDLRGIGNLSSGRALQIAYNPLLSVIYGREQLALRQERELMATSLAVLTNLGYTPQFARNYDAEAGYPMPDAVAIRDALKSARVAFDPVKLAEDTMENATVHQIRISAGYESEETAIRAEHPDWSDEDVTAELDRVGAGKAEVVDAAAQTRIAQMMGDMKADQEEQAAAQAAGR